MDNQIKFFSSEEEESRIKPIIENLEDMLVRATNETIAKSSDSLNPADLDRAIADIELQHLEPIKKEEDYDDESYRLINIYYLLMMVYPKGIRKDAVIECTSFKPYYDRISCSIRENKKSVNVSISSCENIPNILMKLSDKLYPKKLKMAVRKPEIYERHIFYLTRVRAEIYPHNSQYIFPILKIKPLSPSDFEMGVRIIYGDGRSHISIESAFEYTD
jgi:hypothetical protein